MDQNDLLMNHVEMLTKHVEGMIEHLDQLDERLAYYEKVLYTLILALKEGGVIIDSDDGNYNFN